MYKESFHQLYLQLIHKTSHGPAAAWEDKSNKPQRNPAGTLINNSLYYQTFFYKKNSLPGKQTAI